jgi:hypothetical protein
MSNVAATVDRLRSARFARVDIALAFAGLSLAALSLLYPFGHDQGVHYYVGREWALHGAMPYRDAFDYKTPGIFVVHALLVRMFGETTWGIRLAELGCVLALGLLCASLFDARERNRGFVGFVCFVTFVVYYGYFSFWDTAQCEVWGLTFALASIVAARKLDRWPWIAGALAALAFLMKPPAVLLAVPAVVVVARRGLAPPERWKGLRHVALLALGFVAPIAVTLAYFATHHALRALVDVICGADAQYLVGTRRVSSVSDFFEQVVDLIASFHPFGAMLLGTLVVLVVKRLVDRERVALPREALVLAGLAAAAITIQLKFYHYHYALLVAAIVVAIAHVHLRLFPTRPVVSCLLVVFLYALSGPASRSWFGDQRVAFRYLTGSISRETFAARFSIPVIGYNERDSEDAGLWVRTHSSESDEVVVRDFQAEVYAFAHRRAPGRFFWTTALADPKRSYRRSEWLEEDARSLETRPRFVVTRTEAQGIDSVDRFAKLGYARCHASGRLIVLAQPKLTACEL